MNTFRELCTELKINETIESLKEWCRRIISEDLREYKDLEEEKNYLMNLARDYLHVFLPNSHELNHNVTALYNLKPVQYAAIHGYNRFIEQLTNEQCQIIAENSGRSLVHLAAAFGEYATVILLIQKGVSFKEADSQGNFPSHLCLALSVSENGEMQHEEALLRRSRIFKDLVAKDPGLLVKVNREGFNCFHFMALCGFSDLIREYLKVVDLLKSPTQFTGETPLHLAILNHQVSCVRVLLSVPELVNIPDCKKQTPLHYAAAYANKEVVLACLDAGANVDLVDRDNKSPLLTAVDHDNHDALAAFNERNLLGKPINELNQTVLHYAISRKKSDVVEWLLANTDLKNGKESSEEVRLSGIR